MKRILIIDDEKPARDRLCRLVDAMADYEVAGEAINGSDALEKIRELTPDILLLDISMPGMDGMSLAHVLQDSGAAPAIIFCTAYQDQALSAFEVEAVDYVVKPVRAERLEKALDKAGRYIGEEGEGREEQHFLRSTVGGKVVLTPVARVICLVAEDKYTTVVHENGTTVVDESLTELENCYPSFFFRVHRNALVSRKHLRGLERTPDGSTQVLLSGTERQPEVSRRNVSALRKLLSEIS
jgi:two-component system response regulator AlgR